MPPRTGGASAEKVQGGKKGGYPSSPSAARICESPSATRVFNASRLRSSCRAGTTVGSPPRVDDIPILENSAIPPPQRHTRCWARAVRQVSGHVVRGNRGAGSDTRRTLPLLQWGGKTIQSRRCTGCSSVAAPVLFTEGQSGTPGPRFTVDLGVRAERVSFHLNPFRTIGTFFSPPL